MRRHRAFLILLAFAAALFLSDIWTYKEFVRAESYFALGARLMIEQHDWLAPHAPDEGQLNKPPLSSWLIGSSYRVFGANYGSARLPSVFAALGVLTIVYSLGVRISGVRAGLISAGALASSYLFLTFARTAMSDMLLTLFVTASLACFISVLFSRNPAAKRLALLGYCSLALGVLTKGPVALVLVAAPIALELLWVRDRRAIQRLRLGTGTILFLILAAPYFVLVYLRLGIGPLRFFFIGENLQRFTGAVYGGSGRPVLYEVVAFFSDFAPWSLLIFIAGWANWRAPIGDDSIRLGRRVLYLWLLSTIVLFSLSNFKLDYYLLPAMPAAALLIGPMIADDHRMPLACRFALKIFLIVVAVFMVGVAFASLRTAAGLSVGSWFRFTPLLVATIGLGGILHQLRHGTTARAAMTLMVVIWATILTIEFALLPAFTRYLPATQLVASVASDRVWYTSQAASDWANCLAFNLAPPHRVERVLSDPNNEFLLTALKNDSRAVAVIWEREYNDLVVRDSTIRVLAQAETYGHGGLTLKLLRNPKRDTLLVVGHDP